MENELKYTWKVLQLYFCFVPTWSIKLIINSDGLQCGDAESTLLWRENVTDFSGLCRIAGVTVAMCTSEKNRWYTLWIVFTCFGVAGRSKKESAQHHHKDISSKAPKVIANAEEKRKKEALKKK